MYDGSLPFPPCNEKYKVFVFEEIGNIGSTNLELLKELQENGSETIIRVVEIKSDEDGDEATPAKAEWAKAHFEAVIGNLHPGV